MIDPENEAVAYGFTLGNGAIIPCTTPNCAVCNFANICDKCKRRFAHIGGPASQCLACDPSLTNCRECFANNLLLCY